MERSDVSGGRGEMTIRNQVTTLLRFGYGFVDIFCQGFAQAFAKASQRPCQGLATAWLRLR